MRGSPLLRALLAFLAILSLGLPLRRLTRAEGTPPPAPPAAVPAEARQITLQLTFTTPPKSFRVLHLGQPVWTEAAPASEVERRLPLAFPKEGIDLQIQAEFTEGAPLAAVRVRLTDPDGATLEKSLWGTGQIDDVLTFP